MPPGPPGPPPAAATGSAESARPGTSAAASGGKGWSLPGQPGAAVSGKGSAGAGVVAKGKGQSGAGSDAAVQHQLEVAKLGLKGIVLPTNGKGKGQGQPGKPPAPVTLTSVTPTLIRPPGVFAAGPEAAAAVASGGSVASSSLQGGHADALSTRLDEILQRLQVLEQRSDEIKFLLMKMQASPQLQGLD